ncbi:DUF2637 domain-containing protein [Actinoallomurus sp. CA-150999]|uniref:DUF2637 domain-containing protein n=1 Tax=Actinoallomurus sp. CA-150999 TaxID=3239887 RepID=UPI003D8A5971
MSEATDNNEPSTSLGYSPGHRIDGADRAIRVSTVAVVVGVAGVAAFVSCRHAYELVTTHGEDGTTAAVMPLTVDGLIFAASMTMLDAARRGHRSPALARWTLGLGITASVLANVAHGLTHGVVGAVIVGWPALALVLVYELLMTIVRGERGTRTEAAESAAPETEQAVPAVSEVPDPLKVQARQVFAADLGLAAAPASVLSALN